MKSKRAVLAGMLSLLMVFSFFNEGMTVQASTLPESDASSFEMVEISNEEIAPQTIAEEYEANVIERPYSGESYSVIGQASAHSENDDSISNSDPSYAYLVTNDTVMQGAIESNYEMRWYAFCLVKIVK